MTPVNPVDRHATSPPLALSAALLLWGWQAGMLPWAAAMAGLIELARWLPLRFEPGQEDFNRLWNFTTLLFLGVGLYLFLAREGPGSVGAVVGTGPPGDRLQGMREISQTAVVFLRWLPFVLFPFVLAHAWSRQGMLPWSTFSLYLRQQEAQVAVSPAGVWRPARVHPRHLYLAVALFSASAAMEHAAFFLPAFVAVTAWALWPWRNRRFGAPVWVGLLVSLLVVSGAARIGMTALREVWQQWENRLLQQSGEREFDQVRSSTAMGAVGRLKLSGQILMRVRSKRERPPARLREAAFNRFQANTWATAHREFQAMLPAIESGPFRVAADLRGVGFTEISRYTTQGEAPLALPGNVVSIGPLPGVLVETNGMAAARVRSAPRLLTWSVDYGPGGGFGLPPEPDDLSLDGLTDTDRAAIENLAVELKLAGESPERAVETVSRHFMLHFDYALWQPPRRGSTTPSALARFLQETRAGHCEYFATATVLLLRVAGIPTRYAVGYGVQEQRGDEWVVRGRHAHAWCLAFMRGQWEDVDTTPASWNEVEEEQAGFTEGLRDWFSEVWYRFTQWRQEGGTWQLYAFCVSMVVLSWLGWRQLRGSRWRRAGHQPLAASPPPLQPGADSEFYAVVAGLEIRFGPRPTHETLDAWVTRLGVAPELRPEKLREMLRLHYRLRFNPAGLPPSERERLRMLAANWTAANP